MPSTGRENALNQTTGFLQTMNRFLSAGVSKFSRKEDVSYKSLPNTRR